MGCCGPSSQVPETAQALWSRVAAIANVILEPVYCGFAIVWCGCWACCVDATGPLCCISITSFLSNVSGASSNACCNSNNCGQRAFASTAFLAMVLRIIAGVIALDFIGKRMECPCVSNCDDEKDDIFNQANDDDCQDRYNYNLQWMAWLNFLWAAINFFGFIFACRAGCTEEGKDCPQSPRARVVWCA